MKQSLILLFLFLSTFAIAKDKKILEVQTQLETKLNHIIQKVNSDSFVLVEIESSDEKIQLPNLPFVVNKSFLEKTKLQFKQIQVTVVSPEGVFSPKIESLIKENLKSYSDNIIFKYQTLDELQETSVNGFFKSIESQEKIQLFTLVLFIFGFLFFMWFKKQESGALKSILKESVESLSSAIENGSFGGTQRAEIKKENSQTKIEVNTSSNDFWENFPIEGLISLLSDCYWCYEDTYASFVWYHLSVAQRQAVLENSSLDSSYVKYLSSLEPVDKYYIADPYYLDPIEVQKINNQDLVSLIDKHPALLGRLSKLRAQNIPLKASDRIRLTSEDDQNLDLSFLQSIDASEHRILKSSERFIFESIEEEEEIISLPDISMEIMEKYPSLHWALKLQEEDLRKLLDGYGAKQLAEMWIAPKRTLELLEGFIPEKKRQLMHSYLEKEEPKRTSSYYNSFITDAIAILESYDQAESA
jgi:hypothetical protein